MLFLCKYLEAGGQGNESRQKKKMVITEEHFQRITQALVMRLRQHEETVIRDGMRCQLLSQILFTWN